jgi:hypothetical protein
VLRNSKDFSECVVGGTDGTIGHVQDLYFDEKAWVVRYLVVATGAWLAKRIALIPPAALNGLHWTRKRLSTSLTKAQVRRDLDSSIEKPASRPPVLQLHSSNDVMNYHVHARDGHIGQVRGVLVEDETWAIRYLIVSTSDWWIGSQVLVATQWIDDVNWFSSNVTVDVACETLKNAPPYDAALPLDRWQELVVFDHYGRPGYWAESLPSQAREEAQLNAWEDEGGRVVLAPKHLPSVLS